MKNDEKSCRRNWPKIRMGTFLGTTDGLKSILGSDIFRPKITFFERFGRFFELWKPWGSFWIISENFIFADFR